MAMGWMIQAASALAGVNALLLLALSGIWIRNYAQFGSRLVLGLVAFSLVTLVENLLALYFFFSMQSLYAGDPRVQQAVLILRALQVVAFGFLTYVTMK